MKEMRTETAGGPRIRPGEPQVDGLLTIFPLLTEEPVELDCGLLIEAIEAGTVTLTEVGEGSVPELLAVNEADHDVLVLDGEQLIGARQNRIPSRSILLAAGSETQIPVSCMEQGRWSYEAGWGPAQPRADEPARKRKERRFAHGLYHAPKSIRKYARALEAKRSRRHGDVDASDLADAQGPVWAHVAESHAHLDVDSPTSDLRQAYEDRGRQLLDRLERLPHQPDQIGILAFLAADVLGLDVIGGRELYARLHERFITGYVMDAIVAEEARRGSATGLRPPPEWWHRRDPAPRPESGESADDRPEFGAPEIDEAEALRFLADIAEAERRRVSTVGKGAYNVLSGRAIGGELVDGRLIHRSAHPAE